MLNDCISKKWKETIKDDAEKENKDYFADNIIWYVTSSARIGQSINLAHEKYLLIVHLIKLGVKAELHVANVTVQVNGISQPKIRDYENILWQGWTEGLSREVRFVGIKMLKEHQCSFSNLIKKTF